MLENFFSPSSVALIGASREEAKVGHEVLDNLIASGYPGSLYPVNPKASEIHDHPCYPGLAEVPATPDLAVIVVPNRFVPQVVEECGQKGTRAAIIITAGFKESGIEGRRLENEVVAVAQKYGVRLIGPNCLGLIDTATPLNASFAKTMPAPGHIAFISQSGALCTAILDWAKAEEIGFSKFVSFGNRADLSELELIEYFVADPQTRVIAAYLEGVKNGPEFMSVVSQASRQKPIILYKSGGTSAGARAVSSHTGTLAGSQRAYEAAFHQVGAIQARSVQSLCSLALGFACQPLPAGPRVAIVTNAGGPGIITTDTCERLGLSLAPLSDPTVEFLRAHLPPAANVYNPVDVLGDALADRYQLATEVLLQDPQVDALVFLLTPQAMTEIEATAEGLVAAVQQCEKPVMAVFMGEADVDPAGDLLNRNQIPCYPFPEPAVETLHAMGTYRTYRERPREEPVSLAGNREAVREALAQVRAQGRRELGEFEARAILDAYGLHPARTQLAASLGEARRIAGELGYPVVVKIASPDILHKSDVGGVRINLPDEAAVAGAYEEVTANARRRMPDAVIWGVVVQEMLPPSLELIAGVSEDPQFGHLLMVGLGGIYVEVLQDVTFRILPITPRDAREMLQELRASRLLQGVRGEPPADVEALTEVLLRVSQLVTDFPEIVELDLNPLKVYPQGQGCVTADARIIIGD